MSLPGSQGFQLSMKKIVGVPTSYESVVRGLNTVKSEQLVQIKYGTKPPDDDELLQNLTVCISVYQTHAAVQILVDTAAFNANLPKGEHTLRLNSSTNASSTWYLLKILMTHTT